MEKKQYSLSHQVDWYEQIRVRGTVQGVGFRPTVYKLAVECGLRGDVCNDGDGVLIRIAGDEKVIAQFLIRLQLECPPLAKIKELTRTKVYTSLSCQGFSISASADGEIHTEIVADAAICPQCAQDIFDPYSRYFRYPFTNCTHCGPRLSIIRAIPYDRRHTSMAAFEMCNQCENEYSDVTNRRFHAQPIACHQCGPHAWLERADGKPVTSTMFSMLDDVDAVCTLLQQGEIIAIKGIGGVHLACDATNHKAVQTLRDRKQRDHKPLALMARDLQIIEQYAEISQIERELLLSAAAPIVLLRYRQNISVPHIADNVAPGYLDIGFMLPYTPVHHLILKRMNRPIVLTSGNLAHQPQCIDNHQVRQKLSPIADYFLLHNRDIINRVDDSVIRVVNQQPQMIRRARGYAPAPLQLPPGFADAPQILAMGGELKSTFCLLRDGQAILSQHLGDLENAAVLTEYENTLNLYLNLFQHQPQIIAVDRHPEYLSTKLGLELVTQNPDLQILEIQHHHAHIAACMAENQLPKDSQPVLGIAFDGLGFGDDHTFWGGEFLLCNYQQSQRIASFKPISLIGGSQAISQPWRNIYAHLHNIRNWQEINHKYSNLKIIQFLNTKPLALLEQMLKQSINTPLTSSVGRLFDAVAAAIGICCEEISYEGEAAIALENLASSHDQNDSDYCLYYPINIENNHNFYYVDPSPMWWELLDDLQSPIQLSLIALKFHNSLIKVTLSMIDLLRQRYSFDTIAISGGVFQNRILLTQLTNSLNQKGLKFITHSQVPANDGGLSLGQAAIAAAKLSVR